MARKPRPSEIAAKAKKSSTPKAAKRAASKPAKRAAKHGGKVITREDIIAAEQLNQVPTTIKLPSAKFVHDFVKSTLAALDKEKDSAVADIRNAHGSAQEKNHVEKRAMSIAVRLHKMPDSKLQQTMYHLTHYIAALGLWERALKQGQLDLDKVGAEGEGDDDAQTDIEDKIAEADETPAGTDGQPSPKLKLVDAPSTADAMAEAIERDDRKSA
jgi:hypothetical protein